MGKWRSTCRAKWDQWKVFFFLFVWFLKDGKYYHTLSANRNDPVERKFDDEMGGSGDPGWCPSRHERRTWIQSISGGVLLLEEKHEKPPIVTGEKAE